MTRNSLENSELGTGFRWCWAPKGGDGDGRTSCGGAGGKGRGRGSEPWEARNGFSSPLIMVRKKNGQMRPCLDGL